MSPGAIRYRLRRMADATAVQLLRTPYKRDHLFGVSEIVDGLHPGAERGSAGQAWLIVALIKRRSDCPTT